MRIQPGGSACVVERTVRHSIRARQFQMRHRGIQRVLLPRICASKSMHCAIRRIVQLSSALFERANKKSTIKRHVVRHQRTVTNKLYKRSQNLRQWWLGDQHRHRKTVYSFGGWMNRHSWRSKRLEQQTSRLTINQLTSTNFDNAVFLTESLCK